MRQSKIHQWQKLNPHSATLAASNFSNAAFHSSDCLGIIEAVLCHPLRFFASPTVLSHELSFGNCQVVVTLCVCMVLPRLWLSPPKKTYFFSTETESIFQVCQSPTESTFCCGTPKVKLLLGHPHSLLGKSLLRERWWREDAEAMLLFPCCC